MAKVQRGPAVRNETNDDADLRRRWRELGMSESDFERVLPDDRATLMELAEGQRKERRLDKRGVVERQRGRVALDESVAASAPRAAAPVASRKNRTDAPEGYDPELGLVRDWEAPAGPAPTDEQAERWTRLATDLVRRLGPTSAFRGLLPLATVLARPPAQVDASTIRALPQLEALHRALCPGWLGIVESWLGSHALARLEAPQRALRRGDGPTVNLMPPRQPPTGGELLALLRRNPIDLMGDIPIGLTAAMLDYLAARVVRHERGRGGGYTPAKALGDLAEWVKDPATFRPAAEARGKRLKARRAKRRKSA